MLSTPAASILMRNEDATGGFILTASHNPAGPDGDFGIKFNTAGGGQASARLTEAITERTRAIDRYLIATGVPEIDLDRPSASFIGDMRIDSVDAVAQYADKMETLFDFDAIRDAVKDGMCVRFDAMNAVTGPYASEILVRRLGLPELTVMRGTPREDFGGRHADPNPHEAHELRSLAYGEHPPDLLAASDGDGDRNMILGPHTIVSPCDSLAVLAANATRVPGYRDGLVAVARSMPTSHAIDRVAAKLGIPCVETPSGWRYFASLLEAGRISLCGEESFGTSSNHCREKDGLWAVLFWLNLLAVTGRSVPELLAAHWAEYGRTFFLRHDFRIPDAAAAQAVIAGLRDALPDLVGRQLAGRTVVAADDFAYDDPVDGMRSERQGLRLILESDARIVFRLSGTDTAGATLRVYIEDHTDDPARFNEDAMVALAPFAEAARDLARITQLTGLESPTSMV
ncbi:MAG: alpha-D-glucose phosphate-specific phosphoglucomutase [Xanthomonadaceae bacterium]|nr:alpha-D-glucose phosphate-specific phosphoglucomutase [Xanthomonadaceae bacterium]